MTIAGSLSKFGHSNPEVRSFDVHSPQLTFPLRRWTSGSLVLGYGVDASFSAEGDVAALFRGRLDNRPDLMCEIDSAKGDANLLLAAYLKWGPDFLDRFAGDFCCALWDGGKGRLLLGRDVFGRMPLVYHDAPDAFHFACEPHELFALSGISREVDEEMLAEWLARQPRPHTKTFHKGVNRVPPGHILIAEGNGMRLHRYWRPEEKPLLRLRRHEDYAEALLESLEEAVNCRIPSEGQVACTLSAGLDSPTVAALAARQLMRQGRTLTAFTAVPQPGFDAAGYPHRLCDEGPLAATLARMYPNIEHILVPDNAHPLLPAIEDGVRITESPQVGSTNVTWWSAIQKEAQQRSATVLLTGQAGNATISYDGMLLLPTLLKSGRLPSLSREILRLRRSGSSWGNLGMKTIGPFLPLSLRKGIRRALHKETDPGLYDFCCINHGFAQSSGVEKRYREKGLDNSYLAGTDGRLLRMLMFRRGDAGIAVSGTRRQFGHHVCDPTADKRLVELCFSIPEEQYLRLGEPRSLIKRAMKGILPEEILSNGRRGMQSADWHMTLQAQLPDLRAELDRLEANRLSQHYLDLPRMRKLLEALPNADWRQAKTLGRYGGLVRSLAAGVFIRTME